MKIVSIYKAQPVTKSEPVESITLVIDTELPKVEYESLAAWKHLSKAQGLLICDALCSALPQGVVDTLLVELLDRKRSLFIVPMPDATPRPDATLVAAATAHRACCGAEHDPQNGKLHGYCVVCGVPWPCETAKFFMPASHSPAEDKGPDIELLNRLMTERKGYADAVLYCLAGIVPTPEAGYLNDGGVSLAMSDVRAFRTHYKQVMDGISGERECCLAAVAAEPEYPGELPAELADILSVAIEKQDNDLLVEALRITVKLTKEGITERIKERLDIAPAVCTWALDNALDGGPYETACGNSFEINDGSPAENGMKFCPFCGKSIVAEENGHG